MSDQSLLFDKKYKRLCVLFEEVKRKIVQRSTHMNIPSSSSSMFYRPAHLQHSHGHTCSHPQNHSNHDDVALPVTSTTVNVNIADDIVKRPILLSKGPIVKQSDESSSKHVSGDSHESVSDHSDKKKKRKKQKHTTTNVVEETSVSAQQAVESQQQQQQPTIKRRGKRNKEPTLTRETALKLIPQRVELHDIIIRRDRREAVLRLIQSWLDEKPTGCIRFRNSHHLYPMLNQSPDPILVLDDPGSVNDGTLFVKSIAIIKRANIATSCIVCDKKLQKGDNRCKLSLTFVEEKVDSLIFRKSVGKGSKEDFCDAHSYCVECFIVYLATTIPGELLACFGTCRDLRGGCRQPELKKKKSKKQEESNTTDVEEEEEEEEEAGENGHRGRVDSHQSSCNVSVKTEEEEEEVEREGAEVTSDKNVNREYDGESEVEDPYYIEHPYCTNSTE